MDKIIGPLLQGSPAAIVVALLFFFVIQPMSTRLDQMMLVMNREVIPVVNELKKKPLPGPEIKPISELSQQLNSAIALLEEQNKKTRALEAAVQGVARNIEDNKKLALTASVLASNSTAASMKSFKAGDVIYGWNNAAGHMGDAIPAFVVTDPAQANKVRAELFGKYQELGIRPVALPQPKGKE